MIKARRKNFRSGTSHVLAIPAALEIGQSSTLAANRVMLVDPQGKIAEGDLLEFLESKVEPVLWAWLLRKEGARTPHD
jgi:hypothetical protein